MSHKQKQILHLPHKTLTVDTYEFYSSATKQCTRKCGFTDGANREVISMEKSTRGCFPHQYNE